MTGSFVSRSTGGRNRTTAALASKPALVNEKGRYQRMSSISSLLVGEPILLLLPHSQSTTTQPTLHVLSSTIFNTLHAVNESSLELLRSVLHPSFHLQASSIHPRYYLSNTISSTAQSAC